MADIDDRVAALKGSYTMSTTTKIVYNACFGGFGLSDEAVARYAEIKGLSLYPEKTRFGLTTYWIAPESQRPRELEGSDWHMASMEDRKAYNEAYEASVITPRDIPRNDPALVQVVEEMGTAAKGEHADLQIRELPAGTKYRIDEYDGNEGVRTIDDYVWEVA